MTFETEYQLEEYKKLINDYFNEDGKPYHNYGFGSPFCEQMKILIEQMESEINMLEAGWQPIITAPKTGETIEVSYDDGSKPSDNCLAFWSERPVCMGGPTVYYNPGWATAGDNTDKNLPLDEPNVWRKI